MLSRFFQRTRAGGAEFRSKRSEKAILADGLFALSSACLDDGPANEADGKRRSEDQHKDLDPSGKGLEANPGGDAEQSCGAENDCYRAQKVRSFAPLRSRREGLSGDVEISRAS